MNKIKKIIKYTVYLGVFFLFGMVLFNLVAPKSVVKYVGFNWYRVVSGSMEDSIQINDVVIVTKVNDIEDLKASEVITFYAKHYGKEISVTHRIKKIEEGIIYTYGDNNKGYDGKIIDDTWDEPITFSNVVGKVSVVLPSHHISFLFAPVFLISIATIIGLGFLIKYILRKKHKHVE